MDRARLKEVKERVNKNPEILDTLDSWYRDVAKRIFLDDEKGVEKGKK